MSRSLRRALLGLLENIEFERLAEDMLRHRSYWVWVGEFLHPHEYASRFPNVARAFQLVRTKAPDGTKAPDFRGYNSVLTTALARGDLQQSLQLLNQRPGELARRLDHLLRIADDQNAQEVCSAFTSHLKALATPVLLALASHLPHRLERAPIRVYWPKGRVARGVSSPDQRATLSREHVEPLVQAIRSALLARFANKATFESCVVDEALKTVIVPFNERTASSSAISLPRGSRVSVPRGKLLRLFLHWCEPKTGGRTTDLDLSVALYDEAWNYVGVCSYYELKFSAHGRTIAQSAGDLRDAPWPDGASEFVDLDCEAARDAGIRYAVMVVNNYGGLPFGQLERGFAGVMLRDTDQGAHFDPRTVELKFALDGENGVFLPVVFDLRESVLHWLDVHAKGQFDMNNVENSRSAIRKICPEFMAYFASGTRPSMYDLALLHAAARAQRVYLRDESLLLFVRKTNESNEEFHTRLVQSQFDERFAQPPRADGSPSLALLYRGDIALPKASNVYALFRVNLSPDLAASDLLS